MVANELGLASLPVLGTCTPEWLSGAEIDKIVVYVRLRTTATDGNNVNSKSFKLGAAAVICAYAAVAAAQTAGSTIVDERRQAMKAMADAAKAISGMFEGTLPYSGEALGKAAETVLANSGAAMKMRFPEGSLGAPSAAKEEISSDRQRFDEIADRLEELAAALSHAADQAPDVLTSDMRMGNQLMMGGSLLGAITGDPANMPAEHVFHLVLETCTSCHAKFRERQE